MDDGAKFLAAHEADILFHKAAKQEFDKLGLEKLPSMDALKTEYATLFSIADEHQNKGYITEVTSALLAWVFENGKTEFIVAIVKHDNTASNKVIQKLGFAYVGECNIDYDGKMTDFHYYRLEKENARCLFQTIRVTTALCEN